MWVVALTEFRRLMRSGKLLILVALTLLLAMLAVAGATWWWSSQIGGEAEFDWSTQQLVVKEPNLGLRVTWATVVLLLPVCFIAMPVLTADMVAGEREDGTLEMLELTALRPRDLVLGKFLAAAMATAVLALATLPFMILGDLAGGPDMWGTFAFIGTAVLYCLPFAAVGIGRSVRSSTRAEAMRSSFRDMIIWPGVGIAIGAGGAMGVYLLRKLMEWAEVSHPVMYWVTHGLTFPAGFFWTDAFDAMWDTPWFWVGVPIAVTIHCLRQAWVTAAWLEPVRMAETVQARRRAREDREVGVGPRPPGIAADARAGRRPAVAEHKTAWARVARRIRNPVEVLAVVNKRDGAWYFALLAWILPLLVVGAPIAVNTDLATGRGFFPSFAAFSWMALMLAYICMVTPTVVTSEREGGTLDGLRMTPLRPVDIVWGKLKARGMELGLMLAGGAVFLSIFFVAGSLSMASLLLLWASGLIYVAAYSGFGAAASVWCRRSTHSILACWALLFVPVLLSLAMGTMAGTIGHWSLLPASPLLVASRCLVFDMDDPMRGGWFFAADKAYAIWVASLLIHVVIAGISWYVALYRFDAALLENRGGQNQ